MALADAIAVEAHRGQTDKLGVDYIEHPRSVSRRIDQGDEIAVAAGLLHDVVEDSGITAENLLERGVPADVVEVVTLLTRDKDVPDEDYYAAIRRHDCARVVKLADLADNTDLERFRQLPEELQQKLTRKYTKAYRALDRDDLAEALLSR
ncbi:HD domain-containing protein [Williamsia maris]|uniref:HD domain-containing protein n=1 Tax=Williamsia maris TaxID=72806 RepID=UPI0020A24855|nr:HD domain-containing protein [Williamsia maris]